MAPPSLVMQQQLMWALRRLLRPSLAQRPQVSSFQGSKSIVLSLSLCLPVFGDGGAADSDVEEVAKIETTRGLGHGMNALVEKGVRQDVCCIFTPPESPYPS